MDAVRDLFRIRFPAGTVVSLRGADGSEGAIRARAPAARFLHLATHGFFAPPDVPSAGGAADPETGGRSGGLHPGLLSGLVLVGANRPVDPLAGDDDGVLTALEVSALDLRGVELAVLSACETGLGQSAGGEGVLGLQRSFQAAGAWSVVASLWAVPDDPTRVLMERFYRNLWDGNTTRASALREAQLWMLREGRADAGVARGLRRVGVPPPAADGRLPPYYWSAFVLSGEWR